MSDLERIKSEVKDWRGMTHALTLHQRWTKAEIAVDELIAMVEERDVIGHQLLREMANLAHGLTGLEVDRARAWADAKKLRAALWDRAPLGESERQLLAETDREEYR